jgi:hypothetical protein
MIEAVAEVTRTAVVAVAEVTRIVVEAVAVAEVS